MAYRATFRRWELKYLITQEQKIRLLEAMKGCMEPDGFSHSSIRNLYYDTPAWLLARRSMEKPLYKEKLRLRAYGEAGETTSVFAEIKKKYDGVVYKRRVSLGYADAAAALEPGGTFPADNQISREICSMRDRYEGMAPRMFVCYEREAYRALDDDFRVTFDTDIFCRLDRLSLGEKPGGTSVLPEGKILMELKCAGSMPLWMADFLTREKIYKASFSKYGRGYEKLVLGLEE